MLRRYELSLAVLVLLLAAFTRLHRLADLPPGWRDDEVVETTVHAGLVLAGQRPLYFPQAEGHEPLFHYLSAGWIALAGRSLFAVRLLSVFFGLFSLAALYRLARRLFGPRAALLACAGLALSFWGLMYARFKLRHISEVGLMLLAFDAFFAALTLKARGSFNGQRRTYQQGLPRLRPALLEGRGHGHKTTVLAASLQREARLGQPAPSPFGGGGRGEGSSPEAPEPPRVASPLTAANPYLSSTREGNRLALLAGLWLGLCQYTYFAARAVPLILLAFTLYLALLHPRLWRAAWRRAALAFGVAALVALPLVIAIARTTGGEDRLRVVGAPLSELLAGRPGLALRTTAGTLGMFAFSGDPEYLYNIPGRPVFGPALAALFAGGVLLSLRQWRQPRHALLLIWLVGGLAPAFVSIPAASLGHTIAAQPAFYLFPALALLWLAQQLRRWLAPAPAGWWAGLLLAGAYLALLAARDLPDYFVRWPALPEVRRLYRAPLHAAAPALRALPAGSDLALASLTLHPADVLALALETPGHGLAPRAFNPERAWLFPEQDRPVLLHEFALPGAEFAPAPLNGAYVLRTSRLEGMAVPAVPLAEPFANGWTALGYTLQPGAAPGEWALFTYWRVETGFVPPAPRPVEVLSGTPLPLKFFSHLLGPAGDLAASDDRLDVDPATLRPGDTFIQLFRLALPSGAAPGGYTFQVGLYDPASGQRVPLVAGADTLRLATVTFNP